MANFAPYSNYGYFALIKETTAGVAVKPTIYQKITTESLMASFNIQPINEIAGDRERNIKSIQGSIEMSGDVEFFVEEKLIGHWLRSLLGAPVTQTATTGVYAHEFKVQNEGKTYTMDVQPADAPWVHRFFGVRVMGLTFTKEDNGILASASLMPTKAFILAKVTTAANSGTTLLVDQTEGLTTADTILVLDKANGYTTVKELTISSVDSATQLTTSTIDVQLDVGDIVVIKRATVTDSSYTQCKPFQFSNGTTIYEGDDIDNLTAITKEDFEIALTNDLEARYGSGSTEAARYPFEVLTKGYTATGKMTRFYNSELNLARLRGNTKVGIRYLFQGLSAITANSAQAASSTWGASNGFTVTASTAGKAGNDINVQLVVNTTDTLAVTKSGNNIIVKLASTTASNNTGTLIAAAIDALSDVASAAAGTGATTFTAAEDNANLGFKSSGTNAVGLDASQVPYLQVDFADGRYEPFFPSNEEDNIVPEEITFTAYKDQSCDTLAYQKGWSTRVLLVNGTSSY